MGEVENIHPWLLMRNWKEAVESVRRFAPMSTEIGEFVARWDRIEKHYRRHGGFDEAARRSSEVMVRAGLPAAKGHGLFLLELQAAGTTNPEELLAALKLRCDEAKD